MQRYDIAIIGGGIVGCCIARQLARYDVNVAVVEAANDIACGSSKANGGLVHGGYDPKPDSMKAQVNARGCELYSQWLRPNRPPAYANRPSRTTSSTVKP